MRYVVFESGSRAGFSAEMFFRAWKKRHPKSKSMLRLADCDKSLLDVPSSKGIVRCSDKDGEALVGNADVCIFPADEMTRQMKGWIVEHPDIDSVSMVESWYYEKKEVNKYLGYLTEDKCFLKIPKTFDSTMVCIKPNSLSAGSRDIMFRGNVCVSEMIEIQSEYVADVLESDGTFVPFVREVKLRSGYDKMIKLLPETDKAVHAVKQFLSLIHNESDCSLFREIFHIQFVQDKNGDYYFIEASKRISGTSIVNVFRGFNPFDLLEGTEPCFYIPNPFKEGKWYRYEDFVLALHSII